MIRLDAKYKHPVLVQAQAVKYGQRVCGDLVFEDRQADGATFMVLDGIGSGIKANLAAQMFSARLSELLKRGFSVHEATASLVETLHRARTEDILFSAFTLIRILPDGSASAVSYEMPAPIFIEARTASIAKQRFFTMSGEVVGETLFKLRPGSGFIVVSDGITQAGLGGPLPQGLTIEGTRDFVNRAIHDGRSLSLLPQLLVEEAGRLCGGRHGDDATAVLFSVRPGKTVQILTGPPIKSEDDSEFVSKFISSDGIKVVCGSTTSDICARLSGREIRTGTGGTPFEPPEHFIEGIDLVTEGALTLNQLFNILEAREEDLDAASPVTRLRAFLLAADRVHFRIGGASNPGHSNIIFRQLGVLPRSVIVPLIADKLRARGKLVIVDNC